MFIGIDCPFGLATARDARYNVLTPNDLIIITHQLFRIVEAGAGTGVTNHNNGSFTGEYHDRRVFQIIQHRLPHCGVRLVQGE
ncbi:hypothetical protein A247_01070 [Pseudomonas syringae pv. actinidiae ICMP 19099]|nr:hypothetical protein A247_01070 [Pseudomonas syringae pv. actinidiae ICMP 19099]